MSFSSQFLLISKEQYLKGWLLFRCLFATLKNNFPHVWLTGEYKACIFMQERSILAKAINLNSPAIYFFTENFRIQGTVITPVEVRSQHQHNGSFKCPEWLEHTAARQSIENQNAWQLMMLMSGTGYGFYYCTQLEKKRNRKSKWDTL